MDASCLEIINKMLTSSVRFDQRGSLNSIYRLCACLSAVYRRFFAGFAGAQTMATNLPTLGIDFRDVELCRRPYAIDGVPHLIKRRGGVEKRCPTALFFDNEEKAYHLWARCPKGADSSGKDVAVYARAQKSCWERP